VARLDADTTHDDRCDAAALGGTCIPAGALCSAWQTSIETAICRAVQLGTTA
jgi:hypothetical protein